MLNALREILGPGLRWKLRRQLQQTLLRARDCRGTQSATLRRLLSLNRGSDFQRDFRLDGIRSVCDFQSALPVGDYDRLVPYIERVKAGEWEALLGPRNRLLMFALTSGTTSDAKFIPITRPFLRDYRRGWQIWGIRLFDDHPQLHNSPIFQLSSDWDQFRTSANIPCGNISGLVQRMQNRLVRSMYVVPPCVGRTSDPFQKLTLALKHALSSTRLGLITTANPSTLCQMFRLLDDHAEELIRDLHNEAVNSSRQHGKQMQLRRRARELDCLLSREGRLAAEAVWPHLQVVAVWTGGSAAAYLPSLRKSLGAIPIRDHGLHASEGRMTIPLEDETSQGLLDIESHFFEFIPEAESESPQPTVLRADELVEDEAYSILLTTASGLYRYHIRDVVQCTGFHGTTPLLRFLHKGAHIGNLTGEKLTESQVVMAIANVASRLQCEFGHVTLAPEWDEPPRYVLVYDEREQISELSSHQLSFEIETELQRQNFEYRDKRKSGRLAPLELRPVSTHLWQAHIARCQSRFGGSTEQYKHSFLTPKLEFLNAFRPPRPTAVVMQSDRMSPKVH